MERRVTVIVALFVGAIALLGTWLLLTTDSTVRRSETDAGIETIDPDAAAGVAPDGDAPPTRIDPRLAGKAPRGALLDEPATRLRRPVGATPTGTSTVHALNEDAIASAVASRGAQLDDCYATARMHTPGLPSSLSLSLTITPAPGATWGHVTAVAAGVGEAAVFESCAEGALGGLRFETVEPTTVNVPVELAD